MGRNEKPVVVVVSPLVALMEKQYPNTEPQYLLNKGARSWSREENIPDPHFQSTTSQTSTELTINSVTLSDSALYYCALQPSDTKSV
ncbi:hypothetical protein F2P79_019567 [Pimephales promelas]|nr:hypothetical protein F2P79_019567 [Pimephales promelas]